MSNSSWKSIFKNIFQFIDIYGSNVRLYMRGTHTYQTPLGGILTLILILSTLLFAIYFGTDMLTKRNPSLINYRNHNDIDILLSEKDLTMGLKFVDKNGEDLNLQNDSNVNFIIFENNENYLNKTFQYKNLYFNKCESKSFENSKFNEKIINFSISNNFNCINFNKIDFIGSPFESFCKKSIKFFLNVSNSFEDNQIHSKFPITLKIIYKAYKFDLNNYDNPINIEYQYTQTNLSFSDHSNLYFSFNRANLTRDDSLIIPSINTTSAYGFNNFKFITINFTDDDNKYKTILSSEIYLDSYEEIFIRRYNKLADVAAQVTAMARILYILFQVITMLYTFDRINEQLAFKFYKYKFENQATPDELYNRRKTKMQKELSIKVPKKDRNFSIIDRNFQFLYNENHLHESKKSHMSRFFKTPSSIYKTYGLINKISNCEIINDSNDKNDNDTSKYQKINNDSNRSNDMTPPQIINKPLKNEKIKTMNIIECSLKNNNISMDVNNDPISKKYKDQLILNFDKIFHKQDKLSFRDKIRLFFNCINHGGLLREKSYFYLKAKSKIKEKLDIVYILNKLDEFDKFKMMYLNPYQFLALSYCKKANILNTNYSNLIDFYENFCEGSDEKKNIINILEYFIYKIRKKDTDILDTKLLEMIEPEILKAIYENID